MKIKIEKLIDGLCGISSEDFTVENVYEFLGENPIEVDSIDSYLFGAIIFIREISFIKMSGLN